MKTFKNTLFAIAMAVVLVSCGSTAPIVATPIISISPTLKKNAPLTETQLKHWSTMDLVKDTVQGMSVDKTYAELIKNKKGEKL